jgi:hypothetical protein
MIFTFFSRKPKVSIKEPENKLEILKRSPLPLLIKHSKDSLIGSIAFDMSNSDLGTTFLWDTLLEESARIFFDAKKASYKLLTERLSIDDGRAIQIITQLKNIGIVELVGLGEGRFVVPNKSKLEAILNQITLDKKYVEQFYQDHREEIDALINSMGSNKFDEVKDRREKIPQDVMDRVWNRDGGKCVQCGSQKGLEFDHIIPFSKGGANTYRNLQLLCEKCNREKSFKIG